MQNNVAEKIQDVEDMHLNLGLVEQKQRSLTLDKQKVYLGVKRTLDIVISLIALIALSPVLAVTALLIKIDSKGPALLKQERIGKDGKVFKMYKYRSMVVGENNVFADDILANYLKKNKEAREEYQKYKKLKDDPRVTKVGKFIRKTSIDELPQLFNVLLGDMSLVGPRPYLPREKGDMKEYYKDIIQSKPGITGPWQISGRNETTFEDRLNIESTYNKSMGMKFDIQLLLKTFSKVLKRHGAA